MKQSNSLVRLPDVIRMSGLSRATIYRLEAAGVFPARVRISQRTVGWYLHQVEEWLTNRAPVRTEQ